MINLAPHGGDALGATPGHPLLTPALSAAPGLSMSRQQALLDLQAIQRIPGLAGYWPADPAYIYQDSAGYIPATVGGVFGQVRDISNAATPVARRNLLTYSEQFGSGSSWSSYGTLYVAENVILAPDGTLTGDKITEQAAAGYTFGMRQLFNFVTGNTYTVSVFAKMAERQNVVIQLDKDLVSGATLYPTVNFNLTNGSAAPAENSGSVVSNFSSTFVGDGWYKVSMSINCVLTKTAMILIGPSNGTSNTYLGDGASGIYLWGAQLELGAEATPYQKIVTGTGDVFAPGNHAYQQTTANKPYLRRTPTSNVHWLDSNTSTSALTATLGNLGAACTVAQAGAEGVTFTEGVTISSTYNIAPAFGFNTDTAIFNRALTAAEKSLVTRYMQRGVPVLSAEYVANGEFDSSAAWTLQSGVTIENGKLVYNDAYVAIENSNSFTGGLYYLIKSKALTVTSRAYCIATASVSALSQDISTAGTYSEMLYVGDTSKIHVRAREGAGTYTIDYVSVRAVL